MSENDLLLACIAELMKDEPDLGFVDLALASIMTGRRQACQTIHAVSQISCVLLRILMGPHEKTSQGFYVATVHSDDDVTVESRAAQIVTALMNDDDSMAFDLIIASVTDQQAAADLVCASLEMAAMLTESLIELP